MAEHLRHALEEDLGAAVTGLSRVGGGSINETYEVLLADGRRLFAKTHPTAPSDFFAVEAAGLDWLRAADAVRVPVVVAVRDESPPLLVLEWIEAGRADADHPARRWATEEQLGRDLAALHRAGAPSFGWERSGYVGDLGQDNTVADTWVDFYRDRRLAPLARRAVDAGALPAEAGPVFDRLFARLADIAGPVEAPARLHGDLWGGNVVADRTGRPWLVDPAPYGGHREVDLAMLRLFGGFGRRVFAAYEEAHPLAAGHHERVALYQLYPLLVHALLFGGTYSHQCMTTLERCV